MPTLVSNPTLGDIQKYVVELFKAVRKQENMGVDNKSQNFSIQEEMADIIVMLCSIANRFDVNLEEAFRDKEEINKKRKWT